MILPSRRRLGAIALVVAGVGAFLVPFLLHGPALQGTTAPTTPKTPGTTGCTTNCQTSGGPPPHKKNLKDLMNSVDACNDKKHPGWTRSLEAKIHAAMKKDNSTRTDNNLVAFEHELNTPAASNHVSACLSDIKSVLAAITAA